MAKANRSLVHEDKIVREGELIGKPNQTTPSDRCDLGNIQPSISEDLIETVKRPNLDLTEPESISVDGHENCIAAGQINSLGVQMAELSLRLAKMELRITNLENSSGLSGQSTPALQKSTIQQLRSISNQVEIITEGLRSTPGYNIGKTYNCNSCKSMGTIAIKVRCTTCDHENWWGWWPQRK